MKVKSKTIGNYVVRFLDDKGKDLSFDRWRVECYYAPNYAETVVFPSEQEKEAFLSGFEKTGAGNVCEQYDAWKMELLNSENKKMRAIRVLFDDGDTISTNINGNDLDVLEYYCGQKFEIIEGQRSPRCTGVEFLD